MAANQHYIYAHTCSLIRGALFKACPVRRETAITLSSQSSFPASAPHLHPVIHFSPSSVISLPLSTSISSHPHPPHSLIYDFPLSVPCVAVLSSSYITLLFFISPLRQLLSPPILIRSTLRLLLAAFSFSTSARLPPPLSLCPSSLPVPRSSADLSPVRLRPAEMDTPPGKQVRQNRLEGGGKWRDQWQRRTCR